MTEKNIEKLAEYGKTYLNGKIEGELKEIKRYHARFISKFQEEDVNEKIQNSAIEFHIDNYLRLLVEMDDCGLNTSKYKKEINQLINYTEYKKFKEDFKDSVNLVEQSDALYKLIIKN